MESQSVKLTQRVVDGAEPGAQRYALHDTEIRGFRLYVLPSGRKTFHLRYRVGGGRKATIREPKIGDAVAMKCAKAREIASDWHAEVAKGGDPSGYRMAKRDAPTVARLFERYLTEHAEAHKKESSIRNDRRLIDKRLLPALGRRKVGEVTRDEVLKLHRSLSETPYEANRMLALLSKAFNLAEMWGWRPDASNPCLHVQKYAEKKRKRYLSQIELARLGEALRIAEREGYLELAPREGLRDAPVRVPISPAAIAAIRLLVLTGARKGEILGLQWDWIDFEAGRATLPDSKTGEKPLYLPAPALAVLDAIPRVEGNPHVIVGAKAGAALVNLKDPWNAIREAAGIDDVRIHDLRHSFASVGASGGASLPIIGALLGHSQPSTTSRYAHLSDDPLRAAAGQIGNRIAAVLNPIEGDGDPTITSKKKA